MSNESAICRQVPRDSSLARFLSKHDDAKRSGFITRLDRSSISSKRAAFVQALILNAAILVIIASLAVLTVLHDFHAPYPPSFRLAFCLTQDVFIASACLVLLRSTTIPFFFGECRLRYLHGFRETDIVMRRPPRTLRVLNLGEGKENSKLPQAKHQHIRNLSQTATRAVDPQLLYSKLGALLSPEYWTLEYSMVLDAYKFIKNGDFTEEDLDFGVWKYQPQSEGTSGVWTVYELWRMHEIMGEQQEFSMFENLSHGEKIDRD